MTTPDERIAQLIAHRACCGSEHDPSQGKLHGCCVVCGIPWPCEYAGKPVAPLAAPAPTSVDALIERIHGEHGSGLLARLGGAKKMMDAGRPLSTWVAACIDADAAQWITEAAAALAAQQARIEELESSNYMIVDPRGYVTGANQRAERAEARVKELGQRIATIGKDGDQMARIEALDARIDAAIQLGKQGESVLALLDLARMAGCTESCEGNNAREDATHCSCGYLDARAAIAKLEQEP